MLKNANTVLFYILIILISKNLNATCQDSVHMSNRSSIISNWYILILGALYAIFHLPFIQCTATAVDNELISRKICGKLCTARELDVENFLSIGLNPFWKFYCSNIFTLTMMGTAFGNQNCITILDRKSVV